MPTMKRGADWLIAIQNPDGGWGENCDSYKLDYKGYEPAPSTASQTAWALLGLMAAGQVDHPAVARGIAWLKAAPGRRRACGARRITPAAVSRACSICAITAIRNSSRSGRWRATAISRRAIRGGWSTGCDERCLSFPASIAHCRDAREGDPGVQHRV